MGLLPFCVLLSIGILLWKNDSGRNSEPFLQQDKIDPIHQKAASFFKAGVAV